MAMFSLGIIWSCNISKKKFKSDDFPLTSWLRMDKYDVGFTVVCT